MLQTIIRHDGSDITFQHGPDVPKGIAHFERLAELHPGEMKKILRQVRDAPKDRGHEIVRRIDGKDEKYIIKHTGYDTYKILPI